MQNPEAPTNLVEEELSLRALTLAKDTTRLYRNVSQAEEDLRNLKATLKETEERYRQVLAARLQYLPDLPAPTALVTRGVESGKEVRILFRQVDHYLKERLILVTLDPDHPAVDDYELARALGEQDGTWWIEPNALEENEIG